MGGSIADEEEDNFVRGITQYFDGSSISCPHSKNGKYFVGRIFNSAGNVKSWVDGSTANYINPKSVIDWKLGPNYIYIDGNGWSTAPTVDDACFYLCKEPASSTP
ncbi:hypothetical protein Y032_0135g1901 [Ancylostoma ceylanicum]|nr:hypothetical protein Y032_0135g1901 [Ancylostoma ceylanicum]